MTDRLARADSILLRLNLLLLLFVSFLPFPTRLVSEALDDINGERVFVTMYGLTLLGIRITGFALDEYAAREHLYTDAPEDEETQKERRTILPGPDRLRDRDPDRPRAPASRGGRLLPARHLPDRPVPRGGTPVVRSVVNQARSTSSAKR
jgi:hypothetical protein